MGCCEEQEIELSGKLINKILYLTVNDKTIQINLNSLSVINKKGQSIVFGPLQSVGTNNTVTLNAFSTSGLPISYYSTNTSVATVSGNIVTTLAEGITTIIAIQDGDIEYNAATSVEQKLFVVESHSVFTAKYGWRDTNEIPTEMEIDTFLETDEINTEDDYTIDFPTISGQKYFIIAEPITEPVKTEWYANPLRFGDIGSFPETINVLNTTVGPYRVYITNYKTSFNDPIQLKK